MGVPEFQRSFEAGDVDVAAAQFAPEFAFYHLAAPEPARDHALLLQLLRAGRSAFGGDFRFLDHLQGETFHAAPWTTRVNGQPLDGIDLFKVDEHGRIVEFRVLMRPIGAITAWLGAVRKIGEKLSPHDHGPEG